uniref:Uncharacterized protein n=1 Tax=Oryza punctata TaxID=4537 RepID=A0A0E0LCC3_ORYPU
MEFFSPEHFHSNKEEQGENNKNNIKPSLQTEQGERNKNKIQPSLQTKDSGSDTDDETLRHYEESKPRRPVIMHFAWTQSAIDSDHGPIEGRSRSHVMRHLLTELRRNNRAPRLDQNRLHAVG